jgi:hypothetical protein
VPVAWKTASKEQMKFDPRSRITKPDVLEPLAETEGEVAGLLNGPLAGEMCGDAAQMHPAVAVLDEDQDVEALEQHGVHVQEVDGEDPGGLGVQELPPRGPRAAPCPIDARGMQDLPHRGWSDCYAEFRQLAVDPAVSP